VGVNDPAHLSTHSPAITLSRKAWPQLQAASVRSHKP
jgi:hypothetical protein